MAGTYPGHATTHPDNAWTVAGRTGRGWRERD